MLENPKDKPSGGESLLRWQSRTASEMQACLAGQALLFPPHRVWNATPHPGRRRLGVFASFLFFGLLFPIIDVYACPDTRPLWLTGPPRCWNCGTFLSCGETTWRWTGSHCELNRASTFAFWALM